MNDHPDETFSWRLQAAVYGTAFFNGTVQTMSSIIVALLVVGMINVELPLLIGLVLASRQILTVTMSIYSGALMDRFGIRRVILAFGIAGVFVVILYPTLPIIFSIDLAGEAPIHPSWLFIGCIILLQMLAGYTEATSWIGSQALVGGLMRGHPIYAGRMTFSARIGGILGPVVMGMAWDQGGPWGGFGFLALWILGGLIAAWFLPSSVEPLPASAKTTQLKPAVGSDYAATLRLLLIPAIALVIMVTVMRQTGSGVQSSFYVVWLREVIGLSGTNIGILIGGASAASAISSLMVGPLTRRFATHWLLIMMIGLSIVGIAITPMLGDFFALLMIAMFARGIGQGLNLPLMMTLLGQSVGPHLQGRVTALRISFNRLGGALVPLVMGGLAQIIGIANSFYVVGAVGVSALCLVAVWVSRTPAFKDKG
jgi:MFS family permease